MNIRPRRLRQSASLRALVRETTLAPEHLVWPLFVTHTESLLGEVPSMPGVFRMRPEEAVDAAQRAASLGISGLLLFGLPAHKDACGSGAADPQEAVQDALRRIKAAVPSLTLIADTCLCEYTDHGHCGILSEAGHLENDASLPLHVEAAISQARAGADLVAPSSMLDGIVGTLREGLDQAGFTHVGILSYAVKYASAFYGPFRDAAASAPQQGDRKGYQMDPANLHEAVREARLDVEQGADLLMVKPALAYLDVLSLLRSHFPDVPRFAYQVSGEYAMIKAAAQQGWIDERAVVLETLLAMRRAGASGILTYFAPQAAVWLNETSH